MYYVPREMINLLMWSELSDHVRLDHAPHPRQVEVGTGYRYLRKSVSEKNGPDYPHTFPAHSKSQFKGACGR